MTITKPTCIENYEPIERRKAKADQAIDLTRDPRYACPSLRQGRWSGNMQQPKVNRKVLGPAALIPCGAPTKTVDAALSSQDQELALADIRDIC
jgi:hypothetical protein